MEHAVSNSKFHTWMRVAIEDVVATGMLRIEGWLFFHAGEIHHVRAVVEGKTWDGQYGMPRPDVGDIFPAIPQAA